MRTELRGTRCYVAWLVAQTGPLNSLCPEAHDLNVWLSQDLVLAVRDRDEVATLIRQAFEEAEYRDVEQSTDNHAIEMRGRFGSKRRAFLVGLLPFGKTPPGGSGSTLGPRFGAMATRRR